MTKDERYLIEKRKLQSKNLSPKEYEKAIREICKRIKY